MKESFYIDNTKVGLGLFANRQIKKGEKILTFVGPIVSGKEAERKDLKLYGKSMGNALQIGDDTYIYLEDPGRIANHSCNPNSGIKHDIYLVSLRIINKGEEITYDYSCTMDDDLWTLKCKCGEENCREIIKDFKYLPEKLQNKYLKLGIVQKFIEKQYG